MEKSTNKEFDGESQRVIQTLKSYTRVNVINEFEGYDPDSTTNGLQNTIDHVTYFLSVPLWAIYFIGTVIFYWWIYWYTIKSALVICITLIIVSYCMSITRQKHIRNINIKPLIKN